jgi:hypothetical protein
MARGNTAVLTLVLETPADLSVLNPEKLAVSVWLRINEPDTVTANAQVEINSSGRSNDTNEYHWDVKDFNIVDADWYKMTLPLSAAVKTGTVDLTEINFFRFYQQFASGISGVIRASEILVFETDEAAVKIEKTEAYISPENIVRGDEPAVNHNTGGTVPVKNTPDGLLITAVILSAVGVLATAAAVWYCLPFLKKNLKAKKAKTIKIEE